ncbi:TonB-dependent receptor [bacterium]|nr:TonB-dependent receptor [bacterium]
MKNSRVKIKFSVFFVILLIPVSLFAQNNLVYDKIKVGEDSVLVIREKLQSEEVIITATKIQETVFQAKNDVGVVGEEAILRQNSTTTPDILSATPEVLIQKTNAGAGSPIIRGLSGNRVLILVDGIRLNNATFRSGNNQYFNTIDPQLVSKIEIVQGPSSALYGSDALGGVIQVLTKKPEFNSKSLVFSSKISTNSLSNSNSLLANFSGNSKFAVNFGASFKDFNTLIAGEKIGKQTPTGYTELDGNIALSYFLTQKTLLTFSNQFTSQKKVDRYDKLTGEGADDLNNVNPQRRFLSYLNVQNETEFGFWKGYELTTSFHKQTEERHRIKGGQTKETIENDVVNTLGVNFHGKLFFNKFFNIISGFDFYGDFISSKSMEKNTVSGEELKLERGKFPNDASSKTFGFFAENKTSLTEKLSFTTGLRFSNYSMKGTLADETEKTKTDNSSLTFSGNLGFLLTENLNFIGGVSQGFRSPNLEDAFSKGVGKKGTYDIPNPKLKPETSTSFELGTKFQNERIFASVFGYFSNYEKIIERNSTGNFTEDGEEIKQFQNRGKAEISGVNGVFEINFEREIFVKGSLNYTFGENKTLNEPLTRIPPLRGVFSVRRVLGDFWFEYCNEFAREQKRLSTEDKSDTRIGENGTKGYLTFNLRSGLTQKHFDVTVNFENLFDKTYKTHGSGIFSAGRTLIFGVTLRN